MPDNIWGNLEMPRVPMRSFAPNTCHEQYNWTLPDIEEDMIKDEMAQVPPISRPRIPIKQYGLVMLVPIIPLWQSPSHHELIRLYHPKQDNHRGRRSHLP